MLKFGGFHQQIRSSLMLQNIPIVLVIALALVEFYGSLAFSEDGRVACVDRSCFHV